MKIIFDNIIYSLQKSGGGSVYWTELIKRFNNTKEDCSFYDHENNQFNFFRQELKLKNVSKETKFTLKIRRYLPFTERIGGKAIFHSSYYRFSRSKNAINITSVHDFTMEYFRHGLAKWVHFYQKKIALKRSHGIICISENTKKDLLKFHPEIDQRKIRVIYNGVSNDFFIINNLDKPEVVDERFKKFIHKKLVIFIGHRTSYKNFDKAVLAFSKIKNPDYHFLIIGEKLNEKESNLVENNIEARNVTVLSGINNEKLNYLYNRGFALIYPSSYEGFGIPLLEAMKTGLPFVSSDNSSLSEVAGEAGIIIKEITPQSIYEGLISLENKELREKVIKRGFLQAEKFSWDKTFEEYYQFYKELYNAQ